MSIINSTASSPIPYMDTSPKEEQSAVSRDDVKEAIAGNIASDTAVSLAHHDAQTKNTQEKEPETKHGFVGKLKRLENKLKGMTEGISPWYNESEEDKKRREHIKKQQESTGLEVKLRQGSMAAYVGQEFRGFSGW